MTPFPPPQLYVMLAISTTLMSLTAAFVREPAVQGVNPASGTRITAMALVSVSAFLAWTHVSLYTVYELVLALASVEEAAVVYALNHIAHLFVLMCTLMVIVTFVIEMFTRQLRALVMARWEEDGAPSRRTESAGFRGR